MTPRTPNTKPSIGDNHKTLIIIKRIIYILLILLPLCPQAQNDKDCAAEEAVSTSRETTMLGTYYADRFVGRKTACGDIFRQNQYTAAHRSIPMGTYLMVTYPATGQQVIVRVNDRCPKSNVLDMTKIAVHALGIRGSAKVTVSTLSPEMGYYLWSNQDTTCMTEQEYLAYRDHSSPRRISPYPIRPNGPTPPKVDKTPTRPKPPTPKKQELTDTATKVDTAATEVVQTDTASVAPKDSVIQGPLYDIELCIVNSKNAAIRETLRLPQEMQPLVFLEQNPNNQQIRIILGLSNTRSHAIRTQAMLIDRYPDCCVIPHQEPNTASK